MLSPVSHAEEPLGDFRVVAFCRRMTRVCAYDAGFGCRGDCLLALAPRASRPDAGLTGRRLHERKL